MNEPMDDPDLDGRTFNRYHLSVKKFLVWADKNNYEVPATNPSFLNESVFQVEWFLAEVMRSTSKNLKEEKLLKRVKGILEKDEENILENLDPLGKFFIGRLKYDGDFPENRAPLAQFLMGSQRQTYWRNLISDAVYLGDLTLLEYPTLKPITEKQKIEVLGRIFQLVASAGDKPSIKGTAKTWHEAARKIADMLDERDAALETHDSIINLSERVAKEMREQKIHGSRGPLSGATVKREALQGDKWIRPRYRKPAEETGGTGETKKTN